MTEKRTIKEIEDRLRDERADLASTLADLTGRVAPDYLSDQVSQLVRDYAKPVAKRAEEAVRENPVAFALAGAGLAWLLLKNRKSDSAEVEDEIAEADPLMMSSAPVTDDWIDEIDELRAEASARLDQIEIDANSTRDSARDFVKERADVLADFAADLRGSLASGLGDLSDEARERVIKAREAAYSARMKIQDGAVKAGSSGKQMIKDHPLIATALGIAIGAAIVSAMPKPDINRRSFGPRANRLIDEAQRLYVEEKSRVRKVAEDVKSEFKKTARSVSETAKDEAAQTARDISDQAVSAGQDLAERLAQQLADEANRTLRDVGKSLREGKAEVKRPSGSGNHIAH
ncbi:hypothetical protein [Thioclava pacifica]|uniref:DUF3618 domain-containing protein n=1 Tax=Thioclava pacifica DSM 10166 TaxID=1353537 RepID=A0A074J9K2_9RHOB|nr:hypothetical protein [Thioclava pacifica]KEO54276.1 hypothetical protein TP2_04955 [Thioclava pacifica DSM 10166]